MRALFRFDCKAMFMSLKNDSLVNVFCFKKNINQICVGLDIGIFNKWISLLFGFKKKENFI